MSYKIAFLGAGNVAWHLAPALEDAGHQITEVYGRSLQRAKQVTERLYSAIPRDGLDFSESDAEIYILAVRDEAIPEIAEAVILPEASILVHTSGTAPLSILHYSSAEYTGIFYPLQTFSMGQKMDLADVPILIESEDQEVTAMLRKLAKSISNSCFTVSSKDRKAIHVAAVFASNFSNHMIRIAEEILARRGLDFELMKPLIIETISKSLDVGAKRAQTGPAIREDFQTLEEHVQFLSYNPELAELYRLISQDIIDS